MASENTFTSADIKGFKRKHKNIKGVKHTAVVITLGFGAGWSSWNPNFQTFCLFDSRIVDAVLNDEQGDINAIIKECITDVSPESYFCGLGIGELHVKWVKDGTRFIVNEYDGAESVICLDDVDYFTA